MTDRQLDLEEAASHIYTDFFSKLGRNNMITQPQDRALRSKFEGENARNKFIGDFLTLNMSFGVGFLMTTKENAVEKKANQLGK